MKKKVLIVDYDGDSIEEFRQILDHPVFEIATAEDGEKAKKLLSRKAFDLAICEIILPRLHGIALSRWMEEKHPEGKRIIVSSVFQGETYRQQALNEGMAHDYFEKPLNRSKFRDSIAALLDLDIWKKPLSETQEEQKKEEEPSAETAPHPEITEISIEFDEEKKETEISLPEEAVEMRPEEKKEPPPPQATEPVEAPRVKKRPLDKGQYKKIESEISKKFEDALADLGLKK